jgi:hypothetical protein
MNLMRYFGLWFLTGCFVIDLAAAATMQDFQGGAGKTPYTLTQYQNAPPAAVVNGALLMVNAYSQNNVIAFERTDPGLYTRIEAEWDMSIVAGADGLGFALLDTSVYGTSGAGPAIDEEPSLPSAFAVGFDIYCPDDYQRKGSHEISLHFDGIERANRWSSFDYRGGAFNRVRVVVDFVTGGADITVSVAGHVIYDRYFLADMKPFDCRAAFGARTGGLKTTLSIDNIDIAWQNPTQAPAAPLSGRVFNRQLMNGSARNVSKIIDFPAGEPAYERVIMKLTVEEPPGGWDPWDRMMGIFIWDQAQQNRYEIGPFMTPYSKAGKWWFDVTDYQTLLRGSRKMEMWLDSWVGNQEDQKGYWFTVDFDYYKGSPKYRIIGVQNIWNGTPVYGNLNDPTMSNFFRDKQISIPSTAAKTKLRFMVTGHGQSPNSESGAEFIARDRTVFVNGMTWTNRLWRDDCYLNPCRPQGGTWKYSRAGWAPGDLVWPWDIDITNHVTPGKTAAIDYTAQEYYNYTPDTGNNARHWVESQIIFYEWFTNDPVAHWPANDAAGITLTDVSGHDFHGTLTNMNAESWTAGKQCGGLFFDGIDDFVTVDGFNGIAGTQNRTCMAWIKTTRIVGGIVTWGLPQAGQKWNFAVDGRGGFGVEVGSGYISSNSLVADGTWHHVAAVFENDGTPNVSDVRLYLNGRRETPYTIAPRAIDTSNQQTVSLGCFGNGIDFFFQGQMDEVRVYPRALTDSEILSIYNTHALRANIEPNGIVDIADLAALAADWNSDEPRLGDINCDGLVEFNDLMILLEEWLNTL